MANEATMLGSLAFSKGSVQGKSLNPGSKQINVSGSNYVEGSMSVPTSSTALPLGSIATPGCFIIVNLDGTNYIEVLSATGGSVLLKIKPGEFAVGRFGVAAPAVKANTSACLIDYLIVED